MTRLFDAEYVLPLRWTDDTSSTDLSEYLCQLATLIDVTVVDGSADELFEIHHQAWSSFLRHVRPGPWPGRNGKVRGVMTGIRLARHERVVIADDDVRYTPQTLAAGLSRLDTADLVAPQNIFSNWPWHARWDTGRQLMNRAFSSDYPGTILVRRGLLLPGGYDGDVLFENLELIRTVQTRGGTIDRADDLYVDRRPPTVKHFLGQRIRQAYDDFAQPGRLLVEAAAMPTLLVLSRRPVTLFAAALGCIAIAEHGRRRHGGRTVFPTTAALWAPLWLIERSVCIWLAVGQRIRGGVAYGDGRILRAAT